jgi:hypothetical protein
MVAKVDQLPALPDHAYAVYAAALAAFDGPREASPSLVYGAALLMRLGVTPPPGFESRSLRGRSDPMLADNRICARSSTDRASDYGSEGWEFESLRARISCIALTLLTSGEATKQDPIHGSLWIFVHPAVH